MKKWGLFFVIAALLVAFIPTNVLAADESISDEQIGSYLQQVSETRGFEVTREDLEFTLSYYDLGLESFKTMEELSEFLGEVIKSDLSNLTGLYEDYELDYESLVELLSENGEELNDYVFLGDLIFAVEYYLFELEFEMDEAFIYEILEMLKSDFDLSNEEIERLKEHFYSIEDHLSNEETLLQLEKLSYEMMAFTEFETVDELTADQISLLMAIYDEFLAIFHLKAEYVLIKGNDERELSLLDLLKLEDINNAKLKINLYNISDEFLADIIITGEMIGSKLIVDKGKEVKEVTTRIKTSNKQTTEKGGKLPDTATNHARNGLLGLFVLIAGGFIYRKVRVG